MPTYWVYGRQVRSNRAIADLIPSTSTQVDWELTLGATAWQAPLSPDTLWRTSRTRQLQVWYWPESQRYCWQYQDGCTFWLERQPARIGVVWPSNLTIEDAVTYLLGPVMAFMLRLEGLLCLHGSAVVLDDQAVLFLGPGGAGKSTTAALLAEQGCPVLTDDVVVLQEQAETFWVLPGYPRLRLWPTSTRLLYQQESALPRLVPSHPTWNKQYLDLRTDHLAFAATPVPLQRIYLLGARSPSPTPEVVPLTPAAAWPEVLANTSVSYLLDRQTRQQDFLTLGRLLQHIPCFCLHMTQQADAFSHLRQLLQT